MYTKSSDNSLNQQDIYRFISGQYLLYRMISNNDKKG